jgi:hypothetical protein
MFVIIFFMIYFWVNNLKLTILHLVSFLQYLLFLDNLNIHILYKLRLYQQYDNIYIFCYLQKLNIDLMVFPMYHYKHLSMSLLSLKFYISF